jgi:hypothetical protein
MSDSKLFSSDYIYEKIFDLSEDSYMEMRDLVREDSKRAFRIAQIEGEGNDPAKSGTTYGTPHDLASMYGRRSTSTPKGAGEDEVPQGYEEQPDWDESGPEGGRPREKASLYGTNDALGGRDPLGVHGMHGGFDSDNDKVAENYKTNAIYLRNKDLFKDIVFKKQDTKESQMLSEDNIKDLEN